MPPSISAKRSVPAGQPSGNDTLAVRRRYLRQRRRLSDRGWITLWVTVSALVGWLFIVGFAGLSH